MDHPIMEPRESFPYARCACGCEQPIWEGDQARELNGEWFVDAEHFADFNGANNRVAGEDY